MGHIIGLHYNDSINLNFNQQFAVLKTNKKISNVFLFINLVQINKNIKR